MAHYNLIKNGTLETNTASGTGNTTFSGSEMVSLYDGNITSSGIGLTTANTVYFEIDLFNRILLDELSLSFSVSGAMDTALSGIDFYYKNNFQDSYILLDKAHDASQKFYATNLVTHFAPRYIRIISDSVEGTLHELMVYNDDYVVAFGDDGSQDEIVLDEFVEYSELLIFNNNPAETSEVDAYVAIDFEKDNDFNYYLTLADSSDGEYKGILDGEGIDNENSTSYTWEMGDFNGTRIINNSIELYITDTGNYNSANSWTTSNPLAQEAKWGFGTYENGTNNISHNCWDWSPITDTVYVMARNINDDILKLYAYTLDNKEWTFISSVNILISARGSAMVCLGNYLYILTGRAGDFGRYDLSGSVNNWEDLAIASNSSVTKSNQSMCSDKQRYIYSTSTYRNPVTPYNLEKSHARYDTVSGTWTNMNDGFNQISDGSYDGANVMMSHDKERNCIYHWNYRVSYCTLDHIQRYDIPTDTWDNYWYYLESNPYYFVCSYWANYYCYTTESNLMHVINFNTDVHYTFAVADNPQYHPGHLMCFAYNNKVILGFCGHNSTSTPGTIWFYDIAVEPEKEQIGEYTTPIFSIEDSYKSAYLHVATTTSSGNKVSYNDGAANTVMVRSNDTSPRPFAKIFAAAQYDYGSYKSFFLIEGDLINGVLIDPSDRLSIDIFGSSYYPYHYIRRILFDSFNLEIVVQLYETYSGYTYFFYRFKYVNGTVTYKDKTSSSTYYNTGTVRHLALDLVGNIWTYNSNHLVVVRATNMDPMLDITDNDNDFLHTLSPSKLYLACWYTNKAQNKVINLEIDGTEVCSIPMTNPTFIISIPDGGCFVLDGLENKIYRLAYDGSIISSFSIDNEYTVNYLEVENTEVEPRFLWVLVNNVKVLKINVDGTVEGQVITPSATTIQTFPGGCLVEASSSDFTYQVDTGLNIIKTWDFSGHTHLSYVCGNPAYVTYNDIIQDLGTGLREKTNDPLWNETTDDWYDVSVEENTLPLKKYHQVKVKLQADPGADSPSVNKILIPKPVKLSGIQAQESKPVYIKTVFPATAENKVYNTKLRCWWGNKEE